MHIFPYSRRPGTPADKMPGQVMNAVKEERAHRAAEVAAQMEQAYLQHWVGQALPILFEESRDGLWHGHTPQYTEAAVSSGESLHNQVRMVRIDRVEGHILHGSLV